MNDEYVEVTLYLRREQAIGDGKFRCTIDDWYRVVDSDVVKYTCYDMFEAAVSYEPNEVDKVVMEKKQKIEI